GDALLLQLDQAAGDEGGVDASRAPRKQTQLPASHDRVLMVAENVLEPFRLHDEPADAGALRVVDELRRVARSLGTDAPFVQRAAARRRIEPTALPEPLELLRSEPLLVD